MSHLEVESFCLPPDEGYPLYITAKRYRPPPTDKGRAVAGSEDAPTLIVLHSTSFHKEIWEPCLEAIFELSGARGQCFREAWAIESPNHGESAPLNRAAFATPEYATQFGCQGYAQAVHRFFTKRPELFASARLIGVGHSLGANTILLLHDIKPQIYFETLVLVEPLVSPGGISQLIDLRVYLVTTTHRRQDTWASRSEAKRHLAETIAKRKGRGKWDDRVLDRFVKYGLVPTTDGKVTLACTKEQEVAMYMDLTGPEVPVEVMNRLSGTKPMHLVLGLLHDFMPEQVHKALVDPNSPRKFASVTYMPNVGHLVLQERPDELAKVIVDVLLKPSSGSSGTNPPQSKL